MCVCVGVTSGGGGGGRKGGGGGVTCKSPSSSSSAELSASLAFSANSASPDCSRSRVEGRSSMRVCMRRAGAVAGRQRPDRRGRLLRGRRGGLDRCSRGRRSSLPHSAVGCKMCVRAVRIGAHIGRERAAARARGFPSGAGRRTVEWLLPVSVAPSGAAAVAVLVHQCDGRATTPAGTARWRRVGTRVDWSCNRRCLRI